MHRMAIACMGLTHDPPLMATCTPNGFAFFLLVCLSACVPVAWFFAAPVVLPANHGAAADSSPTAQVPRPGLLHGLHPLVGARPALKHSGKCLHATANRGQPSAAERGRKVEGRGKGGAGARLLRSMRVACLWLIPALSRGQQCMHSTTRVPASANRVCHRGSS